MAELCTLPLLRKLPQQIVHGFIGVAVDHAGVVAEEEGCEKPAPCPRLRAKTVRAWWTLIMGMP